MTKAMGHGPKAVIVLGMIALTVACGQGSPKLVMPGSGVGVMQWDWGTDDPFSMNEFVVCLDSPGSARVTDVSFRYVENGLRIDEFALVARGDLLIPPPVDDGSAARTLAEAGVREEVATTRVDSVCPDSEDDEEAWQEPDAFTHLAIRFSKPHDETAGASGIVIAYESGGRERTLEWDLQIILCGQADSPPAPGEEAAEVCDLRRIAEAASQE